MTAHRPSLLARSARAFTAVVSVWCLGCSGYEPLLGALLGRSSGMACEEEMHMESSPGAASPASAVSAASDSASDVEFDCGCGSCHAASPQESAVAVAHAPPPVNRGAVGADLVSVTLALTAPPPKLRA